MNIISRCDNSKLIFLTGSPLELLYSKLKSCLEPDLLNVFSKPAVRNNETIWSIGYSGQIIPVHQLDNEKRSLAATILAQQKDEIIQVIGKYPELHKLTEALFTVPSEGDLLSYSDDNNNLVVFLARWACTELNYTSSPNPVSIFTGFGNSERVIAKTRILYEDGSFAPGQVFTFEYEEVRKNLKIGPKGLCDLGMFKKDSVFLVSVNTGSEIIEQSFIVMPGIEYYDLIIVRPAHLLVQIFQSTGEPASDHLLIVEYEGNIMQLKSDNEGKLLIPDLKAGRFVTVGSEKPVTEVIKHQLCPDENRINVTIKAEPVASLLIMTEYPNGDKAPGCYFFLTSNFDNVETLHSTDANGLFQTSNFSPGDHITVRLQQDETNSAQTTVAEGENKVKITLAPPLPPESVSVKLLDVNNKPVPDAGMDINLASGTISGVTNQDEKIVIPKTSFIEGERVKVSVLINRIIKSNKDNIRKSSFRYSSAQNEYTVRLKKGFNFWWFLLLLPLLLLVKCEKNINVQVVNETAATAIPDIPVSLTYTRAFLYDDGNFFTSSSESLETKTDSNGIARFEKTSFSIYSWIFYNLSVASLKAYGSCVESNTLNAKFHYIEGDSPLIIAVKPTPFTVDFRVVDLDDMQPLPNASVFVITEYYGHHQTDSAKTDANGRVVFDKLPKCGNIMKVTGSLDGYFNDSLKTASTENYVSGKLDERRTLKLKPITEKIVFFVKNCKNDQPVPDAVATITLNYEGGPPKKPQKISTNVNGVGKGNYDKAHIIAGIEIYVEKKYFKPAALNGKYKVREFVKLPESERTICLEAESNSLEFTNIDEKTGKPLVGVSNIVTVINSGKISKIDTITSNANGVFQVSSLFFGDKITIHASYRPNYEDNDYTIREKDGIKLLEQDASNRIIPLKPKEIELTFRTLDEESGKLIDNVTLSVSVDGVKTMPDNSGNGEFTVRAPYSSTISITAEKDGYGKNDSKIAGKTISALLAASQNERDIPLKPKPCVEEIDCPAMDYDSCGDRSNHWRVIPCNGMPPGTQIKH